MAAESIVYIDFCLLVVNKRPLILFPSLLAVFSGLRALRYEFRQFAYLYLLSVLRNIKCTRVRFVTIMKRTIITDDATSNLSLFRQGLNMLNISKKHLLLLGCQPRTYFTLFCAVKDLTTRREIVDSNILNTFE